MERKWLARMLAHVSQPVTRCSFHHRPDRTYSARDLACFIGVTPHMIPHSLRTSLSFLQASRTVTEERGGMGSPLSHKHALAIVHKTYAAVGWHLYEERATDEEQALREQVYAAFRVLDVAVHGPCPAGFLSLCEVCYLRYVPTEAPFVSLKGDYSSRSLCTACTQRLKAEGKTLRITDWKTGEVLP